MFLLSSKSESSHWEELQLAHSVVHFAWRKKGPEMCGNHWGSSERPEVHPRLAGGHPEGTECARLVLWQGTRAAISSGSLSKPSPGQWGTQWGDAWPVLLTSNICEEYQERRNTTAVITMKNNMDTTKNERSNAPTVTRQIACLVFMCGWQLRLVEKLLPSIVPHTREEFTDSSNQAILSNSIFTRGFLKLISNKEG